MLKLDGQTAYALHSSKPVPYGALLRKESRGRVATLIPITIAHENNSLSEVCYGRSPCHSCLQFQELNSSLMHVCIFILGDL